MLPPAPDGEDPRPPLDGRGGMSMKADVRALPPTHLTVVRDLAPDADEALVDRVGRKVPGSLEALYHAASPRLYSVAYRLLGNAEDAREALQDTFVRIWEKAGSYDSSRSRAFSWMVMILRGLCLDKMRKRRLRAPVWVDWDEVRPAPDTANRPVDDLAAMASPGDDFLTAQTLEEVRNAFSTLPKSDQKLLCQAIFSPDSLDELAESESQPIGTVKSRIHRAMLKLRSVLKWDQ